jgi:hypothetical protein
MFVLLHAGKRSYHLGVRHGRPEVIKHYRHERRLFGLGIGR